MSIWDASIEGSGFTYYVTALLLCMTGLVVLWMHEFEKIFKVIIYQHLKYPAAIQNIK